MTKEQFKEILSELLQIKKDEDNLNEAFRKFNPDFNDISFSRYETLLVDTLKLAVDDKYDWIGYWLYERNGKFTKKKIVEGNGKKIPFDNYDDLYNLITSK